MITKERLQELIKNCGIVYSIEYNNIEMYDLSDEDITLSPNIDYALRIYNCLGSSWFDIKEENLFETKEEAEEYWEFGNITRTERLPYISWNERDCIIFTFTSPKFKTYEFRLFKGGNITIWRTDDMYKVFNEPTTKENYTLARRLCVKLFKGDSV